MSARGLRVQALGVQALGFGVLATAHNCKMQSPRQSAACNSQGGDSTELKGGAITI